MASEEKAVMNSSDWIIGPDDIILVTGARGFIGTRVVESLLQSGVRNIRCLVRPLRDMTKLEALSERYRGTARVEIIKGNLLSREDCVAAARGVAVIYHLVVGAGGKSFPDEFLNSVVTTRNILEASLGSGCLKRFVNVSSFAVYSNRNKPRGRLLDEACPIEDQPRFRDAYCYAKVKQDELVMEYGRKFGLPYVIVRPGVVYGPGKDAITGRVGLGTFGVFLHLGGANAVPLSYVDNCSDAIVLAGIKRGIDGQAFNIVDDDLPSSRTFLRSYKQHVRRFKSIYLPRPISYLACYLWERLSSWSQGQLPPILTRRTWHAYWKGSRYSNDKLKAVLGWTPKVSTSEGLSRFFTACRNNGSHA